MTVMYYSHFRSGLLHLTVKKRNPFPTIPVESILGNEPSPKKLENETLPRNLKS